jgi:hypothetical protein
MQQRYYDAQLGRFLSMDPVTANSGTGANFNRYWYADNNPYTFIDPTGRCTGSRIENKDGTCRSTGGNTTETYGARQGEGRSTAGGNRNLLPGFAPLNAPTNLGSVGNIPLLIKGADAAVEIGSKATKWRRIGLRGEELARSLLLASGYEILAEQLYVRTSAGLRITDFVVTGGKCGVDICGFEVKANTATRSNLQVVKDGLIATPGGTVASWFQPAFTYGEPVSYETYLIGVTITPAPVPK